jgi:hypothetical protein
MDSIQDLPTEDCPQKRGVNLFEVNGTYVVPMGGIIQFLNSDGSIIFTPNDGSIGFQSTPLLGNVLRVDSINGNNATGALNGPPFQTINGALGAATSGDVVWILPGTYNEFFTIPNGVSVIGLTEGAGTSGSPTGGVLISQSISTATDLVTMGENSRLENVNLYLSSTANVQLRGIVFPGTTAATARVRGVNLTVTNTNALTSNNTYGIHSTGTGAASSEVSSITDSSIMISTSGVQSTRGVEVAGTSTFNINNCAISVNNSLLGSAFAVETLSGTTCNINASSLSGTGTNGADISQTGGTIVLGNTKLVNADANGIDFKSSISPSLLAWIATGTIGSGVTKYMYLGNIVATSLSSTESFTQLSAPQPLTIKSLNIKAGTAPGTGHTTTCTLRNNGVSTPLTATLSGTATTASTSGISASFAAGQLISMMIVNSASSATANIVVSVELY